MSGSKRPSSDARPLRSIPAALIVVCAAAVLHAAPPAAPDAARGKKIFQSKCVPCHKADGRGGVRLTGNPTPDWRDPKRMADPKYDDAYLRDCMTVGKIKSGMQPVSRLGVKAGEIDHLIAYIRTFSLPKK